MAKPKTVEEIRGKSKVKMTAKRYREAIDALGLSQTRAGEFFGFSDRHGQRMARGEAELLPAVIHLLNLMLKVQGQALRSGPSIRGPATAAGGGRINLSCGVAWSARKLALRVKLLPDASPDACGSSL